MSVPAALSLVRQTAGLVENVGVLKSDGCLAQVSGTLRVLLAHSDERVRQEAARTLIRIDVLVGKDTHELQEDDLAKARLILGGSEHLDGFDVTDAVYSSDYDSTPAAAERRGEVCLEVCNPISEQLRSTVVGALVKVSGVVSVTVHNEYIVVLARSISVAADPVFQADLLVTVEEQLATDPGQGASTTGPCVIIVSCNGDLVAQQDARLEELATPRRCNLGYLDDQATPDRLTPGAAETPSSLIEDTGVSAITNGDAEAPGEDHGSHAGADYLDEADAGKSLPLWHRALSATEAQAESPMPWSFFSQARWGDVPCILEYEEDPCVTARLLRARQRDKQVHEERSRIGRFFSALAGGT